MIQTRQGKYVACASVAATNVRFVFVVYLLLSYTTEHATSAAHLPQRRTKLGATIWGVALGECTYAHSYMHW